MADKSFIEDSLEKAKDKITSITSKNEESKDKKQESKVAGELPETAKDMFGDVPALQPEESEPVLADPPSPDKEQPPDELPKLDLPKSEPKKEKPNRKIVEDANVEEIKMFEEAMGSYEEPETSFSDRLNMHEGVQEHSTEDNTIEEHKQVDSGFFSEFEKFMEGNDVPKLADEVIGKDLLDKMKDFHLHRNEGKPYYFHSNELKKDMKTKLLELRNLEHDWMRHKEQLAHEESRLMQKESEMERKLEELKFIMLQIKNRDEFHREAPENRYFILSDGHALKSLSDLRTALRVMDDSIFSEHFNYKVNHFAEWVRTVFGKSNLSSALSAAKSREELISVLDKFEKPSD